jgi:hypothetical protein
VTTEDHIFFREQWEGPWVVFEAEDRGRRCEGLAVSAHVLQASDHPPWHKGSQCTSWWWFWTSGKPMFPSEQWSFFKPEERNSQSSTVRYAKETLEFHGTP